MLRRLALVPLATLGLATALLVSGAGAAPPSVLRIQPTGVEPNGALLNLAMTDDGSCIVGETTSTNDVATDDNGPGTDVFLFDNETLTWTRITNGSSASSSPSISDDCRYIAYWTASGPRVNVFDRTTSSTSIVASGSVFDPIISGNGEFIVYATGTQIVRVNRDGSSPQTVTLDSTGAPSDPFSHSTNAAVSDDGTRIVFQSTAALVPGDTNGKHDIYLRDVTAGTTQLVSVTSSGGPLAGTGFSGSLIPDISGNGRFVVFESDDPEYAGGAIAAMLRDLQTSTNHVVAGNEGLLDVNDDGTVAVVTSASGDAADTDVESDVYLVNPLTSAVQWASQPAGGGLGTGGPFNPFHGSPLVSDGGDVVAFTSTRTNLVAGDGNGEEDGFVVVLGGGSTPPTPPPPAATPSAVAAAPFIDLVLTKTASRPAVGDTFAPGEAIVYTVVVKNVGTADAADVHAVDFLEPEATPDGNPSGTPDPGVDVEILSGDCDATHNPTGPEVAIRCLLGTIAANGGSATVTYAVTVERTSAGATLTNRAETRPGIDFAGGDADPSNNAAPPVVVVVDDGARECEPETSCGAGPGDETFECRDARCFADAGDDELVCAESAVCTGETGDDRYVCTGEETVCSGGAGDDGGTCRAGARCTEDAGDDRLTCLGEATFCNAGNGVNVVDCRRDADCVDGRRGSELECRDATIRAGRGDHEAEGRSCEWTFRDGDNVLDGSGTNRVELEGAGSFRWVGTGRVFIDAINGERNVVTCERQRGSEVHIDRRDIVRGCEKVLGADVNGNLRVTRTAEREQELLAWVVNFGPATATAVRLRLAVTIREASLLRHRLLADGVRCSVDESSARDADRIVVTCTIPSLPPGKQKTIVLRTTTNRGGAQLFATVDSRAAEPDHRPGNNDKLVSGFSPD